MSRYSNSFFFNNSSLDFFQQGHNRQLSVSSTVLWKSFFVGWINHFYTSEGKYHRATASHAYILFNWSWSQKYLRTHQTKLNLRLPAMPEVQICWVTFSVSQVNFFALATPRIPKTSFLFDFVRCLFQLPFKIVLSDRKRDFMVLAVGPLQSRSTEKVWLIEGQDGQFKWA